MASTALETLSSTAAAVVAAPTPPTVRPLTGIEDLTVYYGLTKTYKRYARDTPTTYEHLITHIPGPSLYSHTSSTNSSTAAPVTDSATLLLPLSYPPTLPPPLQPQPIPQHQLTAVLTFHTPHELNIVRAELAEKEERLRWLAEDRARRKLDKKSKKGAAWSGSGGGGDKKRKGVDGGVEVDDGKRLKLEDGGHAMVDIS